MGNRASHTADSRLMRCAAPERLVRALCRLPVLTYFVAELYSKTVSPGFGHWSRVISDAHMPAPNAELALVIALLVVGTTLVLVGTGRTLVFGVGALIVFQLPTSVIF